MIGFPSGRKLAASVVSLFLANVLLGAPAHPPKLNPVAWSLSTGSESVAPGSTIVLYLHARVADDYHLYSLTTPAGGPIATVIGLNGNPGFKKTRVFQPTPKRYTDPVLGIAVETFSGTIDFPIEVHLEKSLAVGPRTVTAHIRYQSCSSEICLPPVERSAETQVIIAEGSAQAKQSIAASFHPVAGTKPSAIN